MNTYIQTDNHISPPLPLSEGLGGLLLNYDLTKFRIFYPKSLFEPDFKLLKIEHCPICTRKLYWNISRTILRCKSKKSNDKFFIKADTLNKLK